MALKVKAVERLVKFKKDDPGQYRYVMQPELYTALAQDKVIKDGRSLGGAAWTRYHALRSASQECGEG